MDAVARERFSRVLSLAAEDEVYQKLLLHCEFLDEPVLLRRWKSCRKQIAP